MAIDCGAAPENQMQMQIPGLTDAGAELMQEVREWRMTNHLGAWLDYMNIARRLCAGGHYASPNYALQTLRNEKHISIPNAYAPALARIAMEEDESIRFKLARSKVDGFCEVKL